MKRILLIVLMGVPLRGNEAKPQISFSGFIKHEAFADSRQIVASRDGDSLSFPANRRLDARGCDINDNGSFNMLAIQTFLTVKATGVKVGSADLSGTIDVDFRGVSDTTINMLRSYNAYIDLVWKNTQLKFGQYFNPVYVQDCYPETISYNTGGPIEPYGNLPQVKLQHNFFGWFEAIAAAAADINETVSIAGNSSSTATFSSAYQRNAKVPVFHVQLRKLVNKKHLLMTGVEIRRIRPRLVSALNRRVKEQLVSTSVFALAKFVIKPVVVKAKIMYSENGAPDGLLGGYGIAGIDALTDKRFYTNLRTFNAWFEIFLDKRIKPGLFVGFTKNLGTSHCLVDISQITHVTFASTAYTTFGFGQDIDWLLRISPRLLWAKNNFSMGAELEYTRATFGTINRCGRVEDTHPVENTRFVVTWAYTF